MKREFKLVDVLKPAHAITDTKDITVQPKLVNFKPITTTANMPSDAAKKLMKRFCMDNKIENKCTLIIIMEEVQPQYDDQEAKENIIYGYICCRYLNENPKEVVIGNSKYLAKYTVDVIRLTKPVCKRVRKQRDRAVKVKEKEIQISRRTEAKKAKTEDIVVAVSKPAPRTPTPKTIPSQTTPRRTIPRRTVTPDIPRPPSIEKKAPSSTNKKKTSRNRYTQDRQKLIITNPNADESTTTGTGAVKIPRNNRNWTNQEKRAFLEENIKI